MPGERRFERPVARRLEQVRREERKRAGAPGRRDGSPRPDPAAGDRLTGDVHVVGADEQPSTHAALRKISGWRSGAERRVDAADEIERVTAQVGGSRDGHRDPRMKSERPLRHGEARFLRVVRVRRARGNTESGPASLLIALELAACEDE